LWNQLPYPLVFPSVINIMKTTHQLYFIFLIILIMLGQTFFAIFSRYYTTHHYENRIYATIGIEMSEKNDLHKLNEAAHYFGQTIIGWTKFPHFESQLREQIGLPETVQLNAHMQERQNLIFTLTTPASITPDQLIATKNYLQSKLDEYNKIGKTAFKLANVDYEQIDIKRPYSTGALTALLLSIVLWGMILYLRRMN